MKELTREELARGRELLQAAFDGPWTYSEWEIECGACAEEEICVNPDCDGAHVPSTTIEALEAYPSPPGQVVAQISVPGLQSLADKNGEAICWLRNEGAALIEAHQLLLDLRSAIEFIADREEHAPGSGPTILKAEDLVAYAKSLGWAGAR